MAAICVLLASIIHAASETTEEVAQPIATLATLHAAGGWDLNHARRLLIEGTISFVAPARGLIVVQDGEAAAAIHSASDLSNLRPGDRVRLSSNSVYPTITSVPGFPFEPAESEILESFQTRGTNRRDYVDRFRGYVLPPEEGSYRFWISSDDSSELWLSDDDSPAHARRIAGVPSWTDWDEWARFPSQHSEPVKLKAGKRYYIEVRHEQTDGIDHVAVAWERNEAPREVIRGRSLQPFAAAPSDRTENPQTSIGPLPANGILRQVWHQSTIGSPADLQPARGPHARFEARDLAIAKLGHGPLPQPVRIHLGQSLAPAENFRWSETAAEIRSVKPSGDGVDLELFDGDSRMLAHVQSWSGPVLSALRGYLVEMTGVCEIATDVEGHNVPGTLWMNELGALPLVGASPNWNQVPPSHVSALLRMGSNATEDIPVRVRGRVISQASPRTFVLEDEGSFGAYYSKDGSDWTMLGDEVHIPMKDPVSVGLAVSSHGPQTTVAEFDHIAGLGLDAKGGQVGSAPEPGSFALQNGTCTISGAGYDIWNWQDAFYFVHEDRTGDMEFIAHLSSVEMHDVWAKAGLMIRESLAPDAPFVDLVNVGGNRLSVQWRLNRPHHATEAVYTTGNEAASWLKLVRRRHFLPFSTVQDTSIHEGTQGEVCGFLRLAATGLEIRNAFVRPVESSSLSQSVEDERPLIEIRSLATWGRASIPNSFRMRGVVTCNRTWRGAHHFAVQDATGGTFVALNNVVDRRIIQPGTLVDVFCDPILTGKTTQAIALKVVTLGPATMPKPIRHPTELREQSKGDGQWIEVEGIVYSAEGGAAVLRAAGSYLTVEAGGMSADDWSRLVDRRVRVQGVAFEQNGSDLTVLIPSPAYVEDIGFYDPPALSPARSIADFTAARAVPDPSHRVHVVGTLTFVHERLAVIDDGTGAAAIELEPQAVAPKVGDKTEVVGFPVITPGGALTVLHCSLHRLGPGTVPPPIHTTAPAVFAGSLGQRLVTFEAEVVGTATSETGDVLDLQSDGRKFRAWSPSHTRALESIPEGSRIRLTGFSYEGPSYLPSDPITSGAHERSAHFIVRSPQDFVYLQGPPWLGLKRALFVLAALTCILVIVVVWAQVLRRRVRQRTEQLSATLTDLRRETELSATLTERQRLAGEIHDSLEQGISGIMLQLEAALQSPDCPTDIRETISVARNMVSFSHAEIRHAIWDLHSPVLEGKNLNTALQQMVQLIGVRSPAIEVVVHGPEVPIPPEVEHHLLRVAQEAVTNAIKHGKASKVDVELVYKPDTVELTVKDDGCGFSAENHLVDNTHFGLRSLRRRAKTMNASLEINSTPSSGTVVKVVVPLGAREAAGG